MSLYIFSEKRNANHKKRCILHDFSVHTKYELTPPFPPFTPRVQLQINGVAIINTGDSLIALQVTTGNPEFINQNQILGMTQNAKDTVGPDLSKGENSGKVKSNICNSCGQEIDLRNSQKENVQHSVLKDNSVWQQKSPKSSVEFQGRSPKPCNTDYQGKSPKSYHDFPTKSPKSFNNERVVDCFEFVESPIKCESEETMDKENENSYKSHQVQSPCSDFANVRSPISENNDVKNVMSPKSDNTPLQYNEKYSKTECSGYSTKTSPISKSDNRSETFCHSCGNKILHGAPIHGRRFSANSDSNPGTPKGNGTGMMVVTPQLKHSTGSALSTPLVTSQKSFWSPSASSGTTSQSADSVYQQISETCTVSYTVRNFAQVSSGQETVEGSILTHFHPELL